MDDDHQYLLSILITLLILTLLYIPSSILLISPLLASIPLFLIILRKLKTADPDPLQLELILEDGVGSKFDLDHQFNDPFVEWDVRAPLEVIFEEEAENEDEVTTHTCLTIGSSLSKYFPESDSDTTSSDEYPDWDDSFSPGKICLKWDEDDANGLIEIELDINKGSDFELEDNMFEIDILS